MTTEAGKRAVKLRGLFGGETEARATAWVGMIEAEAVTIERTRIRAGVEGLPWTVDQSHRASPEAERLADAEIARAAVLRIVEGQEP